MFEQKSGQFLMFIIQPFILLAISIEEAKKETCRLETMVTAVQEDIHNSSLAYLFSGRNLWTFNIESLALEGVQRIQNKFPMVEGIVESSWFTITYKLSTKTHVYEYDPTLHTTNKTTIDEFGQKKYEQHGIRYQGKWLTCTATYEVIQERDHFQLIMVYHDQTALKCDVDISAGSIKVGGITISATKNLPNPGNVDAEELNEEPCEGMMMNVQHFGDKVRSLLLYAGKEELRLWYDSDLEHRISMSTLFDCSSFWLYLLMFGFIGFVIALILVIAAGVTLVVIVRSRKIDLKDSITEDTSSMLSI